MNTERWTRALQSAGADLLRNLVGSVREHGVRADHLKRWWSRKRIRTIKLSAAIALSFFPLLASAQFAVTVSRVRVTGQKAIVPLAMKNNFTEKIESARAAVFLLDEQGKMIGQSAKWVIGSAGNKAGLPAGGTNVFNFVIATAKPITTTNLQAKVVFNRLILEGSKQADITKDVQIQPAPK